MERRSFLKQAVVGAGAGVVAAPALAEELPIIHWRLASSFPKSLDTMFGASERFCARVAALTGGRFTITPSPAGAIVPALSVLDAVQAGTVEMGHTAGYYYVGKDPTFAFDCAVPFGLTSRQHTAWYEVGSGPGHSGRELMRAFFKDYGIINFMGGNTGAQMGGWFRKEIRSVADFKGLRMRISGLAGRTMDRLGVITQQLPMDDIGPALAKGTIDAAEWVGPYDDEKIGITKAAPYYYAPGWCEAGVQLSFYINLAVWNKLPKAYQAAIEAASYEAHVFMQAKYDAENPAALARLVKNGAKLRHFSKDVLEAGFKAATAMMDEEAARNPKFKAIYEPWKQFRQEQNAWDAVAEAPMQNYLIDATRK